MPNGGSDCCGTCWFNAKNKGDAGYEHARDPEQAFCTIRSLSIEDPFYTYCANHPYRRPDRDPIPIGPVFTGDSNGKRQVWMPSPDTEEIRLHLLELLDAMGSQTRFEYGSDVRSGEAVIVQLGAFREKRAIAGLQRITSAPSAGWDAERMMVPAAREMARKALIQIFADLS